MNFRCRSVLFCIPVFFLILSLECAQKKESAPDAGTPQQQELQSILTKSTTVKKSDTLTEPNHILAIDGLDSLNAIVDASPGKLLVFDMYADWCMPCRMLAPLYDSLAHTHGEKASFFRVDVQKNQDIAYAFKVQSIPLIVFIKDKEILHAATGLNSRDHYEKIISTCSAATSAAECKEKLKNVL